MGAVYFGLDENLVKFFKSRLALKSFVETGTHEGDTLSAFVGDFENLYSVEISRALFEKARRRFSLEESVHLYCGTSAEFIAAHKHEWAASAALYWLDAHSCGVSDASEAEARCPLLEELHSIGSLGEDSVIVIDDARLLLCAPPGSAPDGQWPEFESVLGGLRELSSIHGLAVVNDTIVMFPRRLKTEFNDFCRQHGKDVLSAWDKARQYDLLLQQLLEKEALIGEQAARLKDDEAAIRALHSELSERHYDLLQQQLREKEALIGEQAEQLAARDASIEEMSRQLTEKEACIQGQARQLGEKEALIGEQAKQLSGRKVAGGAARNQGPVDDPDR